MFRVYYFMLLWTVIGSTPDKKPDERVKENFELFLSDLCRVRDRRADAALKNCISSKFMVENKMLLSPEDSREKMHDFISKYYLFNRNQAKKEICCGHKDLLCNFMCNSTTPLPKILSDFPDNVDRIIEENRWSFTENVYDGLPKVDNEQRRNVRTNLDPVVSEYLLTLITKIDVICPVDKEPC